MVWERLASLLGIFVLLGIGLLFSTHRRRIPWRIVAVGCGLQLYLAIFLVRSQWVPGVLIGAATVCVGLIVADFVRGLPGWTGGAARGLGYLGLFTAFVVALQQLPAWGALLAVAAVLVLWLGLRSRPLSAPRAKSARTGLAGGGCVAVAVLMATGALPKDFVFRSMLAVGRGAETLIGFAKSGADFVIGPGLREATGGFAFVIDVTAIILFFSALLSLLYYAGVLPWLVGLAARVLHKTLGVSGAESLSAASNVFMGQTEAPLAVRPYLPRMTRSEVCALMTGGFATIAGSVLGAYILFLEQANVTRGAADLIAASLMSAPAAFVFAKMFVPETEVPETAQGAELPRNEIGSNALDAVAGGVTAGLKLAANVAAMLIVFVALIQLMNVAVNWFTGTVLQLEGWTFQRVYAHAFSPFAFLIGVPVEDCLRVGELVGTKTIFNEFIAYKDLGAMAAEPGLLTQRSVVLSTYALCGFANFASIGIQIGGLTPLAPNQRRVFAGLAFRAMVGGALACQLTACVVSLLGDF